MDMKTWFILGQTVKQNAPTIQEQMTAECFSRSVSEHFSYDFDRFSNLKLFPAVFKSIHLMVVAMGLYVQSGMNICFEQCLFFACHSQST